MSVIIEIKNAYSQINGLSDLAIIDAISNELSYTSGYLTWSQRSSGWDGSYRLLNRKQQFPSGCLERVSKVLIDNHIAFTTVDLRDYHKPIGGLTWSGPQLYDYQNEIVSTCIDKKTGMVKAATGCGKSIIVAKLVYEYNLPTVIYVVSSDLLHQLSQTLKECMSCPIGVVGAGQCDIQKITVCSAWSAGRAYNKKEMKAEEEIEEDQWTPNQEQKKKIREMVESAKVCILDEAQFAGADSIKTILAHSLSAAHRFGLSGSPFRNGEDDILLEAAFGEWIVDLSATKLIDLGYLIRPKIFFRDIPPYETKLPKNWPAVKKTYITNNEVRNKIIIQNILKLLEIDRKILCIFKDLSHGKLLAKMLPKNINYEMVTGQVDSEKRNSIKEDFKQGRYNLLFGSSVYDQGIDIKNLDALVLCGGGKSRAKCLQRIGRVLRTSPETNKKDAIVVDTFDQCHYVKNHSIMRYKTYQTEPGFQLNIGKEFQKFLPRIGK